MRTDGWVFLDTLEDARKRVGRVADLRAELLEAQEDGVESVEIGWLLDRLDRIVD